MKIQHQGCATSYSTVTAKHLRELGKVGHLDFGPASQDLHQVEAFVCLEPTGQEKEDRQKR